MKYLHTKGALQTNPRAFALSSIPSCSFSHSFIDRVLLSCSSWTGTCEPPPSLSGHWVTGVRPVAYRCVPPCVIGMCSVDLYVCPMGYKCVLPWVTGVQPHGLQVCTLMGYRCVPPWVTDVRPVGYRGTPSCVTGLCPHWLQVYGPMGYRCVPNGL